MNDDNNYMLIDDTICLLMIICCYMSAFTNDCSVNDGWIHMLMECYVAVHGSRWIIVLHLNST